MTNTRQGALARARMSVPALVAAALLSSSAVVGTTVADVATAPAADAAGKHQHEKKHQHKKKHHKKQHRHHKHGKDMTPHRLGPKERVEARTSRILDVARRQAGDPYVYGAAGPNQFDCSGFTSFVYRQATKWDGISRSSSAQAQQADRIGPKQVRRGDLVFFYDGGGVYHVAIYAGHHKIWHARNPGHGVAKTKLWNHPHFFGRMP